MAVLFNENLIAENQCFTAGLALRPCMGPPRQQVPARSASPEARKASIPSGLPLPLQLTLKTLRCALCHQHLSQRGGSDPAQSGLLGPRTGTRPCCSTPVHSGTKASRASCRDHAAIATSF